MNVVNDKIMDRLQTWEQKDSPFSSLVKFHRELLQLQNEAESCVLVAKLALSDELVWDRLHQGIPLLLSNDFTPDWRQVQTVLERITDWAARECKEMSGESERLRNIACDQALLEKVAKAWYKGHSLSAIAKTLDIDGDLLTSVVAATMKPFSRAYAGFILPLVEQEAWRRRYCPVCGGKPDFAYLDKEKGARWLLCSHCDTEWLFLRIGCPYCGTEDPDDLTYFTDDEGSHLYRLYVCEQCRTYLKAIDLRRTETDILLPFERITTLDMDRQGQEKGYKAGWSSNTDESPHLLI